MKTLGLLHEYHVRLLRGHLWAWRNDFEPAALRDVAPGEVIRLNSGSGEFIGVGFANPRSHIAFRLLDRQDRVPDAAMFRERLETALDWRAVVRRDTTVCRLVYGESDGLPGLVADRYGNVLVLSQTVAGMEPWTGFFVEELDRRFHPEIIILKNTNLLRRLEGLPLEARVVKGTWSGPVWVDYDGVRVPVDCLEGRKTGLFLDHRENRRLLGSLVRGGERVLDLFSHCGLWSLACLRAGAARAVAVDNDPAVCQLGRAAAAANGWGQTCEFVPAEVGEYLKTATTLFDIVILDPPAFAKKKRYAKEAFQTYVRTNALALQRVKPGGIFVTSSCSSFLDRAGLAEVVRDASAVCREGKGVTGSADRSAWGSHRSLQLVAEGTQALDHPVLFAMPETAYLKCLLFRVL